LKKKSYEKLLGLGDQAGLLAKRAACHVKKKKVVKRGNGAVFEKSFHDESRKRSESCTVREKGWAGDWRFT